jgi:guanine deaminase
MNLTTGSREEPCEDFSARIVTRRRVLKRLTGLVLIATEGSALIQRAWGADQASADKGFDRVIAERFMRRAIELSRKGMEAGDGGPFGAVIVKGERIVGEGWNRVIVTKDPTAHGEVVAIRAATQALGHFNLKGCDLYTSAYPCPMCLGAIYWARLDRIYYANSGKDAAAIGFDDEFIHQQFMRPPQMRAVPEIQILANEARQVFDDYAAKPDHVLY